MTILYQQLYIPFATRNAVAPLDLAIEIISLTHCTTIPFTGNTQLEAGSGEQITGT